MSKVHQIQAVADPKSLLVSASSLKIKELEALMSALNGVLYRKKSEDKAFREKELLRLINETVLTKEKRERYWELSILLEEGDMQEKLHQEFMELAKEEEVLRNTRAQLLIELSQLRNIPLPKLMEQMGLKPFNNG